MTVGELRARMSHAELIRWAAIYREESGHADPEDVDSQIIAALSQRGGR